jgi:two-component system, OmpR family, sensor kinase
VRHELKTPITIVRGHLELLDAANPTEVESTRSLALDELDRMSGLVDDIEALADAQVVVPSSQPVDAGELTRRVFEKASGLPNHRWLLAETADALIELDPRLVTQAWLQLVDNASKYSPAWSTITIGSSERHDEQHGSSVEFWVVDEGMGIPEGSEQRIFERFGRVDSGRGIRGSGLGLPIVMAIANAHGGTVSLTTSPGGSRFGIVVPLEPEFEPARAVAAS